MIDEQHDQAKILWAHLVSEHSCYMTFRPDELDLYQDQHDHEHRGPGTIRNHDPEDRSYDVGKRGVVMAEMMGDQR